MKLSTFLPLVASNPVLGVLSQIPLDMLNRFCSYFQVSSSPPLSRPNASFTGQYGDSTLVISQLPEQEVGSVLVLSCSEEAWELIVSKDKD
jgi:hypothetical protein